MRMHVRARVLLVTICALSLGVAGTTPVRGDTAPARLRMVDLALDSPNIDVYMDGTRAWSDVNYRTISKYADVSAGSHRFEIRKAGADASSSPVAAVEQALNPGGFFTMWTAGTFDDLRAAVFSDASVPNPSPNFCVARFVHSTPVVPDVDVFVKGPNARFEKVSFLHATDYAQMPAGIYDIQLKAAGTEQVIFTISNFNADGGHIHSLAAAGGVGRAIELVEMYDAASAAVTPVGAAQTGEGGLQLPSAASAMVGVLAVVLVLALIVAPRRRLSP
jgi:Domain of unknown function (DUF4397)